MSSNLLRRIGDAGPGSVSVTLGRGQTPRPTAASLPSPPIGRRERGPIPRRAGAWRSRPAIAARRRPPRGNAFRRGWPPPVAPLPQVRRRNTGGRSSQGDQDAPVFAVSDKFQPELAADSHSGALESVQCNTRVGGVEQTVECASASLHADCHGRLGEAVPLHGGSDLIGEDLFDGLFLALFQNALFG